MMLTEFSWLAVGNSSGNDHLFFLPYIVDFQTIADIFWQFLTYVDHFHEFQGMFARHFPEASPCSPSAPKDASRLRIRCLHSCATTTPVDAGEWQHGHAWTVGALEYWKFYQHIMDIWKLLEMEIEQRSWKILEETNPCGWMFSAFLRYHEELAISS